MIIFMVVYTLTGVLMIEISELPLASINTEVYYISNLSVFTMKYN